MGPQHWFTLLVGILLGWLVVPTVVTMVRGKTA